MAKIYVVKMTNKHQREICIKLHLTCEYWKGVILRSYINKKDATEFARICNRTEKTAKETLYYYTIEQTTLY